MTKISAKIVADSLSPQGHRMTSFILTYPRMIHAEVMTHRMFSRNAASSRAIPFKKMVEMVDKDPFIPIAWQKDHKGMQGNEYLDCQQDIDWNIFKWLRARDWAIQSAKVLNNGEVTKQLCNRLLEPFMWYTALVTATEFDNFFKLRCPRYVNEHEEGEDVSYSKKDFIKKLKKRYPDNWESDLKDFHGIENDEPWEWARLSKSGAEIHIQALAEAMWDAMNESTPVQLKAGEWHIPFRDNINLPSTIPIPAGLTLEEGVQLRKVKVAVARCARLSYLTFDGEMDIDKDIALHDRLLSSRHASPFEHVCQCLTDKEYENFGKKTFSSDGSYIFEKGWVDNFRGFKSYRRILGI